MDLLGTVSLALGIAGVVIGLPALSLAISADRRTRERHDVDWLIDFCRHGRLQVHNRGRSTARKFVAYVETSEGAEISSGPPKDIAPGEEWTIELPETRLRRIGTVFFAHVRVEWETNLGTFRSTCRTAEREQAIISDLAAPAPTSDPSPTRTRSWMKPTQARH